MVFQKITKDVGDNTGVNYSGNLSGSTLTIAADNQININTKVDIKVHFTFELCKIGGMQGNVNIFSNGTQLNTKKWDRLSSVYPEPRAIPDRATIISNTSGVPETFKLFVSVQNNYLVKSLAVKLKVDEFTTLSTFKLDGVDISSKISKSGDTVIVALDEALLNKTLIGTTIKELTFSAVASVGATRTIKVSAQYPLVEKCKSYPFPDLSLTYPTVNGTPFLSLPSDTLHRKWVSATSLDGANLHANREIPMDGLTVSYLRLKYDNTGTAGAKQIKNTVQAYRSQPYTYAYIDTTQNILFSIDNGTTKIPVPKAKITVNNKLKDDNGYRKLKPGIAGKPEYVTVAIDTFVDVGKSIIIYWPIIQGNIYDNDTYRPTISAGTAPYSSLQFMMYYKRVGAKWRSSRCYK